MDDLFVKGDSKLPTFDFKYEAATLEIKGRSWPEHALNIYQPAFSWVEEYKKAPKLETRIRIALEYFNTSSSKVVLLLLKQLESLHNSGSKVYVEWLYEKDDFDLEEEGVTIKESLNLPFELVPVEEFDPID